MKMHFSVKIHFLHSHLYFYPQSLRQLAKNREKGFINISNTWNLSIKKDGIEYSPIIVGCKKEESLKAIIKEEHQKELKRVQKRKQKPFSPHFKV